MSPSIPGLRPGMLVVASLLGALAARAATPGNEAERVAAARLAAGDCDGAVIAYRAAVKSFATSDRHLGLGRALLCADRPEAAYPHIALAVEARGSNEAESLMTLIDACLRLGREHQAEGLLNQFGTQPRHERFARQRRAALRRRAGDVAGALAEIRSIEGPLGGWGHRALCVLGLDRRKPDQALPHCVAAVRRNALGRQWVAMALSALEFPAQAAEAARPPDQADGRWPSRVAARYLRASGDEGGAADALDSFRAAGGQSPGLTAERRRLGSATQFAYAIASRAGGSAGLRYDGWEHGLVLSGRVPLSGGLVLAPRASLWRLDEVVEQPLSRLDYERERRRADLDLGLSRRWPHFGLALSGRAGLSVLDSQQLIPRLAARVGASAAGRSWIQLALTADYGPAERAAAVAYGVSRFRVRLAADLAVDPLAFEVSVKNCHYFLDGRTPRELGAAGSVGWPIDLGPLDLVPAVGLTVDHAWGESDGGLPVDLSGNRFGGWLRLRLQTHDLGPLAARAGVGWAPASRGYQGSGWSSAGDGPWVANLDLTWHAASWAEIGVRASYRDELDRRELIGSLGLLFRP